MAAVARSLPEARLVIAGAGHPASFSGEVRRWIAEAGSEHAVVLTGMLDEEDKRAALADCDVMAVPSVNENFCFSMFEAMASRKPVVCSDSLAYAGEVELYDAGITVPRTTEAFAEAITVLLGDPGRRARLGENGAKLARAYSWEVCGRRVEQALLCVLEKRPFPADLQPECGRA
jgi:phosphatidylinositol alpha-mannosyltransferase